MGTTAFGCCTESNQCGADASSVRMGCVGLAAFKALVPDAPEPRACDEADAGI